MRNGDSRLLRARNNSEAGANKRAKGNDASELSVDALASAFNRNKASMGAPGTGELESMRDHFLGAMMA